MMIQPQTPLQPVTDTAQQREMLGLVTEPELAMETKQQRLLLEPKLKDTEREQAPELLIKQQGLEPVLQREMQPAATMVGLLEQPVREPELARERLEIMDTKKDCAKKIAQSFFNNHLSLTTDCRKLIRHQSPLIMLSLAVSHLPAVHLMPTESPLTKYYQHNQR